MKRFTPTPEYPHRFCRAAREYAHVAWVAAVLELCRFGPAMAVILAAGCVIGFAVTRRLDRLSNRRAFRQRATPAGSAAVRITTTIRINPWWATLSALLDAAFCLGLTIGAIPSDTGLPVPSSGHVLASTAATVASAAVAGVLAWLYTYSHRRSTSQHCTAPRRADPASRERRQ